MFPALLGLLTLWNLPMEFPFNLEPENLLEYYQEIYDELIQGGKDSEITILPCLDTLQDHIVYVVVRVKLKEHFDEAESLDDEHSAFSMSITPLALVLPPSLPNILKPILPASSGVEYTQDFEDRTYEWNPPTEGTMIFPKETNE